MGMDVYGREPLTKEGEYFRANVWSWRPLRDLIELTCDDVLTQDMLHKISFNDGYGPECQDVCNDMADRLDAWIEEHKP